MNIILVSALFALGVAFALGLALGFFKQFFAVEEDPVTAQIRSILPGANCGACGFTGCEGYAAALARRTAEINSCAPGGQTVAEQLAAVVGGEADLKPVVAVLACRGEKDKALLKGQYIGVKSCRAAKISTGSVKLCSWGCQGFGDCVKVCKFGAIQMTKEGLPLIDTEKCTGCKACMAECPQHIIWAIPRDSRGVRPLCSNLNVNKALVSKNCKTGCIKCEICVKVCPEQCIKMANGIPVIDNQKCTKCGACVEKCPIKVMAML